MKSNCRRKKWNGNIFFGFLLMFMNNNYIYTFILAQLRQYVLDGTGTVTSQYCIAGGIEFWFTIVYYHNVHANHLWLCIFKFGWLVFLHIIKKNQLSTFFLGRNVQQRLSSIEAAAALRVRRLVGLLLEPACLAFSIEKTRLHNEGGTSGTGG